MKKHGLTDNGLVELLKDFKKSKVSVWPDKMVKVVSTKQATVNRWKNKVYHPNIVNEMALEEIFNQLENE